MCSLYMAPGGSGFAPNRFLHQSRYIYRLGIKIVPRRNPSVPEPYPYYDYSVFAKISQKYHKIRLIPIYLN